jgi:ATP-dependent Lon protease
VLPTANASDLELLPEEVKESMAFDLVRTMDEVMDAVLLEGPLRRHPPLHTVGLRSPLSHG